MQINDTQLQKTSLTKAFLKSYDDAFQNYLNKLQNDKSDIRVQKNLSDDFYNTQKKLRDKYETEKYKLDIKEQPSLNTMISAINYHQKLILDELNEEIKAANKELQTKKASGKYNFLEELRLEREFDELQDELRKKATDKISKFNSDYRKALKKRDVSAIDNLENSLLANLLAK